MRGRKIPAFDQLRSSIRVENWPEWSGGPVQCGETGKESRKAAQCWGCKTNFDLRFVKERR